MFICLANFKRSLVKQIQKYLMSLSPRFLIMVKNRILFNIIMTLFYNSKVFTITNHFNCKTYCILSYTWEKVKEK